LKKRTKNLCHLRPESDPGACARLRGQWQKFFGSFFQKGTSFLAQVACSQNDVCITGTPTFIQNSELNFYAVPWHDPPNPNSDRAMEFARVTNKCVNGDTGQC
jgi:hypothetical protein